MSKTTLIENQWVDIVMPPAPDDQVLVSWSMAMGLLFVLSFAAYLFWQRQPRQRLKRKIKSLLKHTAAEIEPKNKLLTLEKILCQYHHAAQLSYIKLDNPHWNKFKRQLQQACYQPQAVDEQRSNELIKQAQVIFLESRL